MPYQQAATPVGFIGLGNIGAPMATHLVCEGIIAYVYDVRREAVNELKEHGAIGCRTIPELAAVCDHIGICVRDEKEVESVLYGKEKDGIFAHAKHNAVIAIHSTVSHRSLMYWSAQAAEYGLRLIDAAITGGRQKAEEGTLCYMVGGNRETFECAHPIFNTSAEKIIHAGKTGTGVLLKLCNNLVTYAEFLAISEATRLANAGGLSVEQLREVGEKNGIINETMYQFIKNREAVTENSSSEKLQQMIGQFGKLAEKDLDCALRSAEELNIQLPSTERLRDVVMDLFLGKA